MKKLTIFAVLLSLSSWCMAVTIDHVDYHSSKQISVTFSDDFDDVPDARALVAKSYILSNTGKGTLAASPTSVALDSGTTYLMTWAAGEMFNGGPLTIKYVPLNITGTSAGTATGVLPIMTNAVVTGPRAMTVVFSEKLKDGTLAANYTLTGSGLGTIGAHPAKAVAGPCISVSCYYSLTWTAGEFVGSDMVEVTANVKDLAGNVINGDMDDYNANTGPYSIAPALTKVAVTGLRTVDVTFSEVMKSDDGVLDATNYAVSGTGVGTFATNPDTVTLVKANTYRLTWASGEMLTAKDITIAASTATDLVGNPVNSTKSHLKGGKGTPPTILTFDAKSPYRIDVQISEPLLFPTVNQYFTLSGTGKGSLAMYPDTVTPLSGNWYSLEWDSDTAMVGNGALTIAIGYCTDSVGHICKHTLAKTNVGFGVDPLFADQWHLSNTGQFSGTTGEDINVVPVWESCEDNTCRGEGIRIAVVDDGMEITHEDLKSNVVVGGSYNYLTKNSSLAYSSKDKWSGHGQAVAGIIAGRDNNGIGVKGVAPRASLVGYNFLMKGTDANGVNALTRSAAINHISSNSWGPPDGYGLYWGAPTSFLNAITTGLNTGRTGLGTIYVWAAGNGYSGSMECPGCVDNSNEDAYANNRGVIAVGAVSNLGFKSSYSEWGANLWVSAPGGEFCGDHAITTTDRTGAVGINIDGIYSADDYSNRSYTKCMNGTSSATPIVSGVSALVLQANPNLGWRDVRYILAKTARQVDVAGGEWTTNGGNLHFSHQYGFGVVDADAAVLMAADYEDNFGDEIIFPTPVTLPATNAVVVNEAIDDNDSNGVTATKSITSSGIDKVEWVDLVVTVLPGNSTTMPTYSGDLKVTLTSPQGTVSTLAVPHSCYEDVCDNYLLWKFSSAAFLDEDPEGDWIINVSDENATQTGTFVSYDIKIYGH